MLAGGIGRNLLIHQGCLEAVAVVLIILQTRMIDKCVRKAIPVVDTVTEGSAGLVLVSVRPRKP